jgi:hypothetical protein
VGAPGAALPVDDAHADVPSLATLGSMDIEVLATEVHALADRLRAAADGADDAGALLAGPPAVGAALQPAAEAFLDCHRTAIRAMAGELRWLGSTVASVADSWLALDTALIGPALLGRGRAPLE